MSASNSNPLHVDFCGLSFDSPIVLLSGCVGFGEEYTRVEGYSNADVGGVVVPVAGGVVVVRRIGGPGHRVVLGAAGGGQTVTWKAYVSSDTLVDGGDTMIDTSTASPLASGATSAAIPFAGTWPAYAGNRNGQNIAAPQVGLSSLPLDPFSELLTDVDVQARVLSPDWPPGSGDASIQATEYTYGLMMHMSTSLGVNCTFCHNSRQFQGWDSAPPARMAVLKDVVARLDIRRAQVLIEAKILEITRLERRFDIHETIEQAAKSLR